MTRRWGVLALVALLSVPAAACSDDGPGEGEARLEVEGVATVERADGDRETVDDDTDVRSGDRVSMQEGTTVMRLAGGSTFELRRGVGDAAGTTVLMGKRPVLEQGDLLVTTPRSTTLEADGTEVVVREGAARLARAFGMSASAYDADLTLDSAGVAAVVPTLRQVVVPDLGRPQPPRPIGYDEQDPWDFRYLSGAMRFGEELERLATDLTGMLSDGEGRTVGYLRLVLPGLEDEQALESDAIAQSLVDREAGDNVIGAAITDLGERGSFDERWSNVFGFRDQGAAWGIVALDQAVRREPLKGSVEQAFNSSFDEIAQAPDDSTPPDDGGPDGSDGGTDSSDGTDGGTDDGGDDGGTDGGASPSGPVAPPVTPPITPPVSPPTEPPPVIAPIVEPVVDLVEELIGGLLP